MAKAKTTPAAAAPAPVSEPTPPASFDRLQVWVGKPGVQMQRTDKSVVTGVLKSLAYDDEIGARVATFIDPATGAVAAVLEDELLRLSVPKTGRAAEAAARKPRTARGIPTVVTLGANGADDLMGEVERALGLAPAAAYTAPAGGDADDDLDEFGRPFDDATESEVADAGDDIDEIFEANDPILEYDDGDEEDTAGDDVDVDEPVAPIGYPKAKQTRKPGPKAKPERRVSRKRA